MKTRWMLKNHVFCSVVVEQIQIETQQNSRQLTIYTLSSNHMKNLLACNDLSIFVLLIKLFYLFKSKIIKLQNKVKFTEIFLIRVSEVHKIQKPNKILKHHRSSFSATKNTFFSLSLFSFQSVPFIDIGYDTHKNASRSLLRSYQLIEYIS